MQEIGEYFDEVYPDVDAVLARADAERYTQGVIVCQAEGIAIRPQEPVYSDLVNGALSMKAVSNEYLLKKAKKD